MQVKALPIYLGGAFSFLGGMILIVTKGGFYFVKDQFFKDFPDKHLMSNKDNINGKEHKRPCFFAIKDSRTNLIWLIPLSSQVTKFKSLYNHKIAKYGQCDTIVLGEFMGYEKAFLIQNMFPITEVYLNNEYRQPGKTELAKVCGVLEKEIATKAQKVLALQRQGKNLIFPDVLKIEKELLSGK
jgi:hypothetical protein